jgi:FkbM family methyltransferase
MSRFKAFKLLINPLLVKLIIFFRPRRFAIRFYTSVFFRSLASPPQDSQVEVVSGYGRNLKMILAIGDKSKPQETYYWLGLCELDVQRLFTKIIKNGFVVYDVGAFLGFHSLLAARFVGPSGRVYAFEPYPKNIKRINSHILLNKMQDRVFCIPRAITDKNGQALCQHLGQDDVIRFTNIDCAEKVPLTADSLVAETIYLDEFVFQEGHPAPNLIKIDVEGQELKVLLGARRLLQEFKPVIICELHSAKLAQQIYEELRRAEYRIQDLRGKEMPPILEHSHIIAYPDTPRL